MVLTVPASFDDVARTLTVEAARKAGLENLTLLEEPQAAFYCWLVTHSAARGGGAEARVRAASSWTSAAAPAISASSRRSSSRAKLGFVRQAVGDHLLLGGDNMDLALAKFVEGKLPGARAGSMPSSTAC